MLEYKLVLCGIIVIGCFLAGKTVSDGMKRRKKTLKDLVIALTQMEAYVMASMPVGEIYPRLAGKGEVGEMFSYMSEAEEINCVSLWKNGMKKLSVTDEDKKALTELSGVLGKTTADRQKKAFEICLADLEKQLEKAEGKYEKEGALYQKLGACAGLLLSFFLI